eukprot:8288973-Karenia_brevis.AAC.1
MRAVAGGARSAEAVWPNRTLAQPYSLVDLEPLAWKRVGEHHERRKILDETLKLKWKEATTGPPEALREMLEGPDEQF